MNSMSYKGYTARIEFDGRDNIFVGHIMGTKVMISFHAETVSDLRKEFEISIESYLADCAEQGVNPEKPSSGKILLRIPPEIHGKAMHRAVEAGKSLNQWASEVLTIAVNQQ